MKKMNRSVLILVLFSLIAFGCGHTSKAKAGRGLLRLDVEPKTAEVFVNDEYRGVITGWRGETIPMPSGQHMVEIRAEGYITQRFDIEVFADEEVTLTLKMERQLDLAEEPDAVAGQ